MTALTAVQENVAHYGGSPNFEIRLGEILGVTAPVPTELQQTAEVTNDGRDEIKFEGP